MVKKNRDYWSERFKQIEQIEHGKGVKCYVDIEKLYQKAQRQIEAQIEAWYGRFATNNGITLEEARKWLSAKQLAELKWDVQEYIQHGQANAINKQWMTQLENASARYHISRLESLKIQMQQQVEDLFGNEMDMIDQTIRSSYKDSFYRTAFEIQKGIGVGWDFGTIDDGYINKTINKPWTKDGKNFSSRIWTNKQMLVNELNTTLTRGIITGQDPQKIIDVISSRMKTSKNNAGRLVMTEQAFFGETAQHDSFTELGVDLYEVVATIDAHTSEICQDMDGKVFHMSQWEVGVTAPPFHVLCRSTTVPSFNDEFDLLGERAARAEDGEPTYYIPANMTYKDWQKAFVDGDKSGLNKVQSGVTIKEKSEVFKELKGMIDANKIKHNKVKHFNKQPTESEIIDRLAGGDMTKGSCSSLAFAYCGNKNGLDVLDFRGGSSQEFFSVNAHIKKILELPGVVGEIQKVQKEALGTWNILKELEQDKEYYLAVGKHAAIVRRTEKGVEYLELQSKSENGWLPFEGNKRYDSPVRVLMKRFGCRKTVDKSFGMVWKKDVVLMEVDSFKDNDEFEELLGYINTTIDEQKKGVLGDVK